jgi:hypothetical protein
LFRLTAVSNTPTIMQLTLVTLICDFER